MTSKVRWVLLGVGMLSDPWPSNLMINYTIKNKANEKGGLLRVGGGVLSCQYFGDEIN